MVCGAGAFMLPHDAVSPPASPPDSPGPELARQPPSSLSSTPPSPSKTPGAEPEAFLEDFPSGRRWPHPTMSSDPRKKLLNRLGQSGLLSGEQERRRQERDLKDYPDIAALARVAKTKENFHDIIGSPQISPASCASTRTGSPQVSPVSCASTSTGSESLPSPDQPSPELLPSAYENLPPLDLIADSVADALANRDLGHFSPPPVLELPQSSARCDADRADLLWKLAGHGSLELKPLDTPELETDGSQKAGVYLLSSPKLDVQKRPFQSIFKPLDEEAFERRGIEIGMGALREEAAFVIDRASGGQANVPTTARASIDSKKGSVQQFVEESLGPVEDFSVPRELPAAEAMVPLDKAQAVACLDIRIFNTDRHTGNLLLAGPRPHKIVCIDHGCVLPAWWALESARFDAWLDWPHVKAPASPATLSLVSQVGTELPIVVQELEALGLPKQAIWTLQICTLLLQKCVLDHGLTLHNVALLMTRQDPAEPCWLEHKVAEACTAAGASAAFKPEGKYGDLTFQLDPKIVSLFQMREGAAFDNKHLLNFRDAFFIFLNSAFSNKDVIRAADDAEEAARSPWE